MLDDYKKQYGKAPNMYVLNYYNAVRTFGVLAAALEKAGKPITGENLLAQRKATKTFDFVGATVSFADNGTIQAPIQINEIGDKGAQPIDRKSVVKGKKVSVSVDLGGRRLLKK